MGTIHLVRASQVLPLIGVLEERQFPVRKIARMTGLPIDAVLSGNAVLGEYVVWRFMDQAAMTQKAPNLGYECACENPINEVGHIGGMWIHRPSTLGELLNGFIDDIRRESSGCDYRLETKGESAWFVRPPIYRGIRNSWQIEQYFVTSIIQIIRICAGSDWLPSQIHVSATTKPMPLPQEWEKVEFSWGGQETRIKMPKPILHLPCPPAKSKASKAETKSLRKKQQKLQVSDLLKSHIQRGEVKINTVADELGMSVSTLQRSLRRQGSGFAKEFSEAKLEIAKDLLEKPGYRIKDIATLLGYSHVANFSRSFSKSMGMSPNFYRKQFVKTK